jgi:hypothetical protein
MKLLLVLFQWVHKASAILFGAASLVLFVIAAKTGAEAIAKGLDGTAAQAVIEAVGLMAAATRVRRFLSRFFVVVIVALVIEGLVATFKAIHEQLQQLVYAGALLAASALLLAGWGVFIYLNRFAEDVEPEAMEEAKREDAKVNG